MVVHLVVQSGVRGRQDHWHGARQRALRTFRQKMPGTVVTGQEWTFLCHFPQSLFWFVIEDEGMTVPKARTDGDIWVPFKFSEDKEQEEGLHALVAMLGLEDEDELP